MVEICDVLRVKSGNIPPCSPFGTLALSPKVFPELTSLWGPWKNPKTVLRSRVEWERLSMVRVIKEKLLLHYATSMQVLLVIVCLH